MGGTDALIHVAGAFKWKRIEDSSVADWRALYAANVETTLAVVNACLPSFGEGGSIVAVGAASAEPAGVGMAAYGAAKSGVARLIEALAQDLAPRPIRANAALPSILEYTAQPCRHARDRSCNMDESGSCSRRDPVPRGACIRRPSVPRQRITTSIPLQGQLAQSFLRRPTHYTVARS